MIDSPLDPSVTEMLYGKPVPLTVSALDKAVAEWKSLVKNGTDYLSAALAVRKSHDVTVSDLYDALVSRGLIIHW